MYDTTGWSVFRALESTTMVIVTFKPSMHHGMMYSDDGCVFDVLNIITLRYGAPDDFFVKYYRRRTRALIAVSRQGTSLRVDGNPYQPVDDPSFRPQKVNMSYGSPMQPA